MTFIHEMWAEWCFLTKMKWFHSVSVNENYFSPWKPEIKLISSESESATDGGVVYPDDGRIFWSVLSFTTVSSNEFEIFLLESVNL